MDDLEMDLCYDLCWWAIPAMEKFFGRHGSADPGGLVSISTSLDWVIDLDLEGL